MAAGCGSVIALADRPAPHRAIRPGTSERLRSGPWAVLTTPAFLLPGWLYLVAGIILAVHYDNIMGDAQNRVADAFYVLFSRDPHLAAIGFVWNPLPTLAALLVIPFKFLWPPLIQRAVAGTFVSAAAMAGAVYQVHGYLLDVGTRRVARTVVTALFAVHPMILYYGANGMSEAMFIFLLLLTSRHLARWLHRGDQVALVGSGLALALAYLTRPEAVFALVWSLPVVVLVAARRHPRRRWVSGGAHALVYAAPCVTAISALAAISWVVVGHPFEQFSSVYGTASQIRVLRSLGSVNLTRPATFALRQVEVLAPALPLVLVAAAGMAWRRRRHVTTLAPLAVLGGVVAMEMALFAGGQTVGSTRYFITAIPLLAVLTGSVATALQSKGRSLPEGEGPAHPDVVGPPPRRRHAVPAGAVAAVLLLPSLPVAGRAMLNSATDPEDQSHLAAIFAPGSQSPATMAAQGIDTASRSVAAFLDHLRLARGAVVADTFTACVPYVVLNSSHPKQFVITNDRDFQAVLADPVTFHARYLLVPPRGGYGDLDALNRAYPSLYADGAGVATLTHQFSGANCTFRLYQVKDT